MAKKINVNALEKATKKQYSRARREVIINGEVMGFSYDTVFKYTSIKDMILEWIALKEATLDVDGINLTDIFMVLHIKYFTDIEFVTYNDALTQILHYAKMGNYFVDLMTDDGESMIKVVTDCFAEEEVQKVTTQMGLIGQLLVEELSKENGDTEEV